MRDRLGNLIRLNHILEAVLEIEKYTLNISFEEFWSDSMRYNATLRQLEIIGEAANRLSEDIYSNNLDVPWKRLIGLRNVIVHEYFGIDDLMVWNIITINIKDIKPQIIKIIDSYKAV